MPTAPEGTLSRASALELSARRLLDWPFHCWYWGDAIAVDALLEADADGDGFRAHAVTLLTRWFEDCPPNFDDVLAPGAAIVRLVQSNELPAGALERLLGRLDALPRCYGAVPALEPHRPAFRFGLCIDALYHLPPLYALAGRLMGDPALVERGIRIALDGMRLLRCPHGWAQWFDAGRRSNNGIAWSRGLGWALLGLLDLIGALEQPAPEVEALANEVLARLAETQEPDGNWRAVIGDSCPTETSTASFYVAACLHASAARLQQPSPQILQRAVQACRRALRSDGTYEGVSSDVLPAWDRATYWNFRIEPSPWAQGAAVRAFAALAKDPAGAR